MGYEEQKFVDKLSKEKLCILCGGVLDNPLLTPCGHTLCSGCVLPAVLQNGYCPVRGCEKVFSASDLKNDVELRGRILEMKVLCDFACKGCNQVVTLGHLPDHVQGCHFRPIQCSNRGCCQVLCQGEVTSHERHACKYRPTGICQKGCGLVLLYHEAAKHSCLEALRCHITTQELKVSSMESEIRGIASRFNKREKSLLAQTSGLHSEFQQQAATFQKKLADYKARIGSLAAQMANYMKEDGREVAIVLRRGEDSLGFNIVGGCMPEEGVSSGILVSRVGEGGPAEAAGLKQDDKILQVNNEDLAGATHEEAVEIFRTAQEPIVVKVLRKVNKDDASTMKNLPIDVTSIGVQTDPLDDSTCCKCSQTMIGVSPLKYRRFSRPACRHGIALSSNIEMSLTDIEASHDLDLDYEDHFDIDKAFDNMVYEEVTLQRSSTDDKLGLTLCSRPNRDVTDVFVDMVERISIAGRHGNIREGDLILQVNGHDIHSIEQAKMLLSTTCNRTTLLIARPDETQVDDGFLDGRGHFHELGILEEQPDLETTAELDDQVNDEEGGTTDTNSSQRHDKDSGVGRTDDSTKNEESSEQEMMDDCTTPGSCEGRFQADSRELNESNDSFTSNDSPDQDQRAHDFSPVCDNFQEVLETRCNELDIPGCQDFQNVLQNRCDELNIPNNNTEAKEELEKFLELEFEALNREMAQIQLECQEVIDAHSRAEQDIQSQSLTKMVPPYAGTRMVPRMGTRLDYLKHQSSNSELKNCRINYSTQPSQSNLTSEGHSPTTSQNVSPQRYSPVSAHKDSATAQSQRIKHSHSCSLSNTQKSIPEQTNVRNSVQTNPMVSKRPLTLQLHIPTDSNKKDNELVLCLSPPTKQAHSDSERQERVHSQTVQESQFKSDGNGNYQRVPRSQSSSSISHLAAQTETQNTTKLGNLYTQYADVMYTNSANLAHTIMLQQNLFQQQLTQKGRGGSTVELSQGNSSPLVTPNGNTHPSPDQSCYNTIDSAAMEWVVKRRPDGSRYITRRPIRSKLLKERAKKVSEERSGMTTDDDAVSELKTGRYWSKDERKRHLERAKEHKRRKESMLKAKTATAKEKATGNKELNIVELSHKKMMRNKDKKLLDDFTTLQEIMVHGSRDAKAKMANPLLSVTTV